MRVYIMTDLEGVAGVLDFDNWCLAESRYYLQARELLTGEVNAAVEGFLAAGANDILVADGHGEGGINPLTLHPAARLSRHWPKGKSYPFALDSDKFDVAASIGQHPKAGTLGGHLCHTGSFGMREMTINGRSMGEFGELVLCASELGVATILASGCEAFAREAQELVPGIEAVGVKRGLQTDPGHHLPAKAYKLHNAAAIHLSPTEARRRIREAAERALQRFLAKPFGMLSVKPPYELVSVTRSTDTEAARIGVKRHPSSVIGLLNSDRGESRPIAEADPLMFRK